MTPEHAMSTTKWDVVAAKAGVTGVLAYTTAKRVMVRHGQRVRAFDPDAEAWITSVILWLRDEQ